jgi:hypothetical protein
MGIDPGKGPDLPKGLGFAFKMEFRRIAETKNRVRGKKLGRGEK